MQSGRLYEGQPLTRRGAHTVNDKPNPSFPTGSLNYDARALALVQDVGDAVTDVQIDSAARWGAALRRSGEAIAHADWFGHRDVTNKSCPGDKGYVRLGELNALTDYYTQYGLGPSTSKEDEMPYLTFHVEGDASQWRRVLTPHGTVDVPTEEYYGVLVKRGVIKESQGLSQREYDIVSEWGARPGPQDVLNVRLGDYAAAGVSPLHDVVRQALEPAPLAVEDPQEPVDG
jgi:hypothetical protein